MPAFAYALGGAKGPDPHLDEEPQQKPVDERAKAPPPPRGEKPQPDVVDISKAANQIHGAVKGMGTDDSAVLTVLQGRSPEEIESLRAQYMQRYGKSLDAVIQDEMGGKELAAARKALAGDKIGAAAATLEAAAAGWGTNEELIQATLRAFPDAAERKAVAEAFRQRTGKRLDEMLDDELSGRNKEQAKLLMEGKRAEAAVVRLMMAMGGPGTDEKALFSTLEGLKSEAERQAVIAAYEKRTGRSLDADLKKETSGNERDIATSLEAGDMVGAKAAKAREALDGAGTDEELLRETFDGTSGEEADAVRARYAEKGGNLDADLTGDLGRSDRLEIGTMLPHASSGPKFGTSAFETQLDEMTHSRASDGNQTEMLFDGVNSFRERMELIDKATESINMQTFIFNSDATGWAMATKLAAKARQGVKVRVMVDGVGSGRADEKMFDLMREAGVEVRVYHPLKEDPLHANHRSHEKQLIIDGNESIQGGMNIADEYALGGSGNLVASRGNEEAWRDTDIRLQGPAVRDATVAFLKQWNDLGEDVPKDEAEQMLRPPKANPEGTSNVRVVHHRPSEDGDSNIENLYLSCIRAASQQITIENAYFIPSEEMQKELILAARRGVKVRVMTNSRDSNDNHMVADASRYFYDDLVAQGVELVEKHGGTLHAKTASFDGTYAIVGSANLNSRSRNLDAEVVLAVNDPAVAQQIDKRFDEGKAETESIRMRELAAEGIGENAREWLFSRGSGLM